MTANSGGLYPAPPAAPLALGACTSLVRTVAGSFACVAAAVPRGAPALLPTPLWLLVEQTSRQTWHQFALRILLLKFCKHAVQISVKSFLSLHMCRLPQLVAVLQYVWVKHKISTTSAGTEVDLITVTGQESVSFCVSLCSWHALGTQHCYFNYTMQLHRACVCTKPHLWSASSYWIHQGCQYIHTKAGMFLKWEQRVIWLWGCLYHFHGFATVQRGLQLHHRGMQGGFSRMSEGYDTLSSPGTSFSR